MAAYESAKMRDVLTKGSKSLSRFTGHHAMWWQVMKQGDAYCTVQIWFSCQKISHRTNCIHAITNIPLHLLLREHLAMTRDNFRLVTIGHWIETCGEKQLTISQPWMSDPGVDGIPLVCFMGRRMWYFGIY
jgi:hypothetical protein